MRPTPLAPPFARRMAPLAALAGLVFGVALPATYESLALRARAGEAQVWARDTASAIERAARSRPKLWVYDAPTLTRLTEAIARPPVEAHVRLDVHRERAFEAGPTGRTGEVAGWAPVEVAGRVAGRLEVRLDAASIRSDARRLWLGALLGGLLLAAALYFVPVVTVRRGDARDAELWRALEEANAQLEARVEARTRELSLRESELSALGARLVRAQEEERARISRDLHDDLGQTLTGLRLRLTTVAAALAPEHPGQTHLAAALVAVDAGVEQVRHLAHGMRPAALDSLGLVAALRGHAEQFSSQAGLKLELDLDPREPTAEVAEVLFRVAQEALTNVARHAEASVVRLSMGSFDDGWRLVVEDDGRGLATPAPWQRKGLGLVGARERVEQAGGYLDVEPAVPKGLRVVAWVPPGPEGAPDS